MKSIAHKIWSWKNNEKYLSSCTPAGLSAVLITLGNYWKGTLIISYTVPGFHSHLIESGSETITGNAQRPFRICVPPFPSKSAPVRETSCQPTANWSLPYVLGFQVGTRHAPPFSFHIPYAHGYIHARICSSSIFHHTPEDSGISPCPFYSAIQMKVIKKSPMLYGCDYYHGCFVSIVGIIRYEQWILTKRNIICHLSPQS